MPHEWVDNFTTNFFQKQLLCWWLYKCSSLMIVTNGIEIYGMIETNRTNANHTTTKFDERN